RLPSPSAQVDVAFRPQLERGDWPDEDRRARLVNDRFAITPDRLLAGVDPMPTTRSVERDNLLSTAQIAEREVAAIAHRLLCPPHEFSPSVSDRTLAAASGTTERGPPVGRIGQLTTFAIFAVRRSIRPSP